LLRQILEGAGTARGLKWFLPRSLHHGENADAMRATRRL
jgi:hypothetical protein